MLSDAMLSIKRLCLLRPKMLKEIGRERERRELVQIRLYVKKIVMKSK